MTARMQAPPLRFSVIIPTKDRPEMLVRALRSVLDQRDADLEIIVADDGTGQGAAAAEAMAGSRVVTVVTGALGQVPARNLAVRRASGDCIAFLDDDDWWASDDYLAALALALRDGGLAYASGRIVREGAGAGPDDWLAFAAHIDLGSVRRDNTLLVSGIAYERGLHAVLGSFDETLPVYWDWDWYLRLAEAGTRFTAAATGSVRISARTDNVSGAANRGVRQAELLRLCDKHGLEGVVLKNHESIAVDQSRGG